MNEYNIIFKVFVGDSISLYIWISTMISLRIFWLKNICYLFSKENENSNTGHMNSERVDGMEIEYRWLH